MNTMLADLSIVRFVVLTSPYSTASSRMFLSFNNSNILALPKKQFNQMLTVSSKFDSRIILHCSKAMATRKTNLAFPLDLRNILSVLLIQINLLSFTSSLCKLS